MANITKIDTIQQDQISVVLTRVQFFDGFSTIYRMSCCVMAFGIPSNAINIVVFYRMGLTESGMNVSFFALSISDLMYLLSSSVCVIATFLWDIFISSYAIKDFVYWYTLIFYDTSMFLVVFIAVVRCCCIAMPLHFKNMFTPERTVVIIGIIAIIAVSVRIPMVTVQRLRWGFDPYYNATKYRRMTISNFNTVKMINDLLCRNIIPWSCFIIVFISLIVLIVKLRSASQFRQSIKQGGSADQDPNKSGGQAMSSKELRVIKSVTLVSTMFIILALPFIFYSIIRLAFPENYVKPSTIYLFHLIIDVSQICGYLNSSLNLLLYYYANPRYRSTLSAWLGFTKTVIDKTNRL